MFLKWLTGLKLNLWQLAFNFYFFFVRTILVFLLMLLFIDLRLKEPEDADICQFKI